MKSHEVSRPVNVIFLTKIVLFCLSSSFLVAVLVCCTPRIAFSQFA